MINNIKNPIKTMPSVEPISDTSWAEGVTVGWMDSAETEWLLPTGRLRLSTALVKASMRPIPITSTGRRLYRFFSIAVRFEYIMFDFVQISP